jgi:ABC-type transporter Mla maintaining outer membrane lipid asymmetry ATPase subunit MlaF
LFAFSDIRRLQGGVSYNIAIYDELFDSSFDSKGIEIVTDILQERADELSECIYVISHRKESLKAVTGDIIFLEKSGGITRRVNYTE